VQLPQPRDRKSEGFTQLVDYIYKVLTKPMSLPLAPRPAGRVPGSRSAPDEYQMLPTPARRSSRTARTAARQADVTTSTAWLTIWPLNRRPAADCGCRAVARLPHHRGRGRGHHRDRHGIRQLRDPPQKELFRDAALANVLLLRQIRRALESKSDHTVPEDFSST